MTEQEMRAIVAAAEKLVRCKGRYHSEQNYSALAALFGVTVPDLEPLAGDNLLQLPEHIPCPGAPGFIWLQTNGTDSDESNWPEYSGEVTWEVTKQFTNDTLYVRADLMNSSAAPNGWVLIPLTPSLEHLKSIACRYRHDFYLLNESQRDGAIAVARQMYEECSGEGFFTIPLPPQPGGDHG